MISYSGTVGVGIAKIICLRRPLGVPILLRIFFGLIVRSLVSFSGKPGRARALRMHVPILYKMGLDQLNLMTLKVRSGHPYSVNMPFSKLEMSPKTFHVLHEFQKTSFPSSKREMLHFTFPVWKLILEYMQNCLESRLCNIELAHFTRKYDQDGLHYLELFCAKGLTFSELQNLIKTEKRERGARRPYF